MQRGTPREIDYRSVEWHLEGGGEGRMRPGGEAGSLSLSLSGRTREAAICNAHNFARRAHGRCEATAKFQFPIVGRGRQPLAIMAIVIRFRISFPSPCFAV